MTKNKSQTTSFHLCVILIIKEVDVPFFNVLSCLVTIIDGVFGANSLFAARLDINIATTVITYRIDIVIVIKSN